MKILALTNLYPPDVQGGYELGCSQVVDALRTRGYDVEVAAAVSANAKNQNCEAKAPMKPANSDGFHRPRIALSTPGARASR